MVQRYPVRATSRPRLREEELVRLCREFFESAEPEASAVRASYGALAHLKVWADGKELAVEVTMNPKVEEAVAQETIRRYNRFLEEVTGYSAKERASRLRKAATKGEGRD